MHPYFVTDGLDWALTVIGPNPVYAREMARLLGVPDEVDLNVQKVSLTNPVVGRALRFAQFHMTWC